MAMTDRAWFCRGYLVGSARLYRRLYTIQMRAARDERQMRYERDLVWRAYRKSMTALVHLVPLSTACAKKPTEGDKKSDTL